MIKSGTLEIQGDGYAFFREGLFSGVLTIGGSLDVRSGGNVYLLDGGTIEGGG